MRKSGQEAAAGGNLEALLGIFAKLLALNRHFQDSFAILDGIVGNLPMQSFQQFLPRVSLLTSKDIATCLCSIACHKWLHSYTLEHRHILYAIPSPH